MFPLLFCSKSLAYFYRGGKMSKDAFEPMMMIKYMKSLVQPGEAVGLLAAQVRIITLVFVLLSMTELNTTLTLN